MGFGEEEEKNDGLKGRRRWNDWREMNNESYEFERKKMKFDNGGSTKLPHFVYAARKNKIRRGILLIYEGEI